MKHSLWNYLSFAGLSLITMSAAFAAGFLTRERVLVSDPSGFPLLHEVREIVRNNYLGELPADTALEYGAAHGMVGSLNDPYSRFVEPPAHELESNDLHGSFGGIGAELRYNEAGNVTLSPYPDLPAAKAGIEAGEILLAVDGTEIVPPMTLEEVSALIRGPVGSEVRLQVQRPSQEPRQVSVVREQFEIPSVTWRRLDDQPTIGVIAISRFSGQTPAEVRRAYDDLTAQGVTALVLDLRENLGGLLTESTVVAADFLDGGIVAYEQHRQGGEEAFPAPGRGFAADIPLVVLVNHNTASAAEIVAGALVDRDRAPLIGEKTYGKGSVQLIFDLTDGSSVHITSARWYTPLRTPIDGQGLTPTFEVPARTETEDPPLDRAIEYLLNEQ